MKKLLSFSIVLSLGFLACNTSSHAALIDFTIMLTGPQETPGNASGAAGGGIAVFDSVTDQISVNVLFTGLSDTATASHIHDGAPGASGPVIVSFVPFTPATTVGTITGTPQPFPAARVSDLLAGNTYFEIRDAALPIGEIRGQLVPVTQSLPTITPVPVSAHPTSVNFVFGLTGSQETPANAGGGAAGGIATYDAIGNTISISAAFTGLSSPATASHVHDGAPRTPGPVIVSFVPFTPATTAGTIAGTPQPFPAAHESDLLAGNTYFDIHDAALIAGEIRGQLMPVVQAPSVPEPSSILLICAGLIGLLFHWSARSSSTAWKSRMRPFRTF